MEAGKNIKNVVERDKHRRNVPGGQRRIAGGNKILGGLDYITVGKKRKRGVKTITGSGKYIPFSGAGGLNTGKERLSLIG